MNMDLRKLAAEFPRASVHWRVQGSPFKGRDGYSAMALAYIDARDVMDRLDEVCGPENWQAEYTETASGRVLCRIGIRCGDAWVWKSDGAGSTQVEGEKGGISDALKRAAVAWGIGRYLYRLDSPWVACEVNDRNGKVYWKRWAADPWAKAKVGGYASTLEPEPAEPEAPRPPADLEPNWSAVEARDRIKLRFERAMHGEDLTRALADEKADLQRLKAEDEPKRLECDAAYKAAAARIKASQEKAA